MEDKVRLTRQLIQRFRDYHDKNPGWGSLHIVLADRNVEDYSVQYCINLAGERSDSEGVELGRLLLRMTKTQRSSRKLCEASHPSGG